MQPAACSPLRCTFFFFSSTRRSDGKLQTVRQLCASPEVGVLLFGEGRHHCCTSIRYAWRVQAWPCVQSLCTVLATVGRISVSDNQPLMWTTPLIQSLAYPKPCVGLALFQSPPIGSVADPLQTLAPVPNATLSTLSRVAAQYSLYAKIQPPQLVYSALIKPIYLQLVKVRKHIDALLELVPLLLRQTAL